VVLTVGSSSVGQRLVAAHSGAIAGGDAAWEALADAYGLVRYQTGDLFRSDRIPLVSHGRRSDLSFLEGFAEFGNLGPHQVPAVAAKLAERSGQFYAGEQVIGERLRRQNLRADRRGGQAELF